MTAAATWDPRYCEAVCPWSVTSPPRCRRYKWQVTPAVATQVVWTTHEHVRTCTWVVRCRSWQRRPQSNYIDITAGENGLTIYFPPGKFIFQELTTLVLSRAYRIEDFIIRPNKNNWNYYSAEYANIIQIVDAQLSNIP